jgi:hypothetical protein
LTPISNYPDIPIRKDQDRLRFVRYAEPLVDLLASPATRTPLTVGIFGPWGSGKSTLLELIEEGLTDKKNANKFITVRFNPWIHRRESNLLVPLLHSLHDALETWKDRLSESFFRIFDVLARLAADKLLKTLTLNAVDLDRLNKLEKEYLESHKKVESEMRNLRETLRKLAEKVGGQGARLVFLIDDLDRCQPDDIIDLLEAVKLFLDVEHVIVLLAVDKEVIDRGIQMRYEKFKFEERAPALGAEYLEKMVQLPLTLLPLDVAQVGKYLDELGLPKALQPYRQLLASLLLPSPRKIKRVLNILAFTQAIIERAKLAPEPSMDSVVRLVVLQAQDGALYDRISRQPELLDALQVYYDAVANGQKPDQALARFGERAPALTEVCKEHHRPGTYLGKLFAGKPFKFDGKDGVLPLYMTLLGA